MAEVDWETPVNETDGEMETTREQVVDNLVSAISLEIREAHKQKYDMEDAERTAALCLEAQIEVAEFLSDNELIAREKKLEVERLESEQYFYYKTSATGKTTDTYLKQQVAKDPTVLNAKKEHYKAEADYNKWKNLFGTLKDAQYYFRGIGRGNSEWS